MKTKNCVFYFILLTLVIRNPLVSQVPWFGQISFPHDSMVLTSAIKTSSNVGYLMAGARPFKWNASQANFVIDKVDDGGLGSIRNVGG